MGSESELSTLSKFWGPPPGTTLRIRWSGRHEPGKALLILLHAIACLKDQSRVILDILGDGPERRKWQALAAELRIKHVNWLGRLP